VRFDFHHTTAGWRISEANSDVPGGLNEASGLSALMAEHYPGTTPAGDTAGAYMSAISSSLDAGAHVAFVHATAYSDDRQVMTYLSRRFAASGLRTSLVSPAHLRWDDGRARLETTWTSDAVDAVVRFFPAEWLPNLPSACGWSHFFHGGSTPVSNPASAILTQSKRFPLTWEALPTPMPTWRALLPETRDPRDVPRHERDEWVLKPALGRVGEDIVMSGVTEAKPLKRLSRDARWFPSRWAAQRRRPCGPGSPSSPCKRRRPTAPPLARGLMAGSSSGTPWRPSSTPPSTPPMAARSPFASPPLQPL